MKKILAAVVALSMLALAGCDNGASVGVGNTKSARTVCIDGYAFVFASGAYAVSTAQIWEDGPNGPRPMMCGQRGRVHD